MIWFGAVNCKCRCTYIWDLLTNVSNRAKYPLVVVNRLIEIFGQDQLTGYDIGCVFDKTANSGALTGPQVRQAGHSFVCGSFHGHAHHHLCQLDWHPLYREGCGLEDFEGCEQMFYESNALARKTCYGSKFHRQQAIVQHFQRWDSDKHEALSPYHFILSTPFFHSYNVFT